MSNVGSLTFCRNDRTKGMDTRLALIIELKLLGFQINLTLVLKNHTVRVIEFNFNKSIFLHLKIEIVHVVK